MRRSDQRKDELCRLFARFISVYPSLMMHGQPIQHFPEKLPLRHELIHQSHEAAIVSSFEEMDHFMNHDIFQTFTWLLGQFRIETDAFGVTVATSPLGLHALYEEPLHLHTHDRLPFRDQ